MSETRRERAGVVDPDYRAQVARAVRATVAMGLFVAVGSWVIKHVDALYLHEPWVDDPYDAVVSFAMTALVIVVVALAARASLNGPGRPGMRRRCADLLRAGRLVVWLAAGTELSDWISVVLGTGRATWNGATLVACGVLAMFTVSTLASAVVLRRAGRSIAAAADDDTGPDWLADAVTVLAAAATALGARHGGPVLRALDRLDDVGFAAVRRRPLGAALVLGVTVAVVGGAPQLLLEHYPATLALVFVVSTACSFYAFAAVVGGYLRVVDPGPRRPPSPATVAGIAVAIVVPVAASFRAALWPLLGVDPDTGGPTALLVLCVVAGLLAAAVTVPAVQVWRRGGQGRSRRGLSVRFGRTVR